MQIHIRNKRVKKILEILNTRKCLKKGVFECVFLFEQEIKGKDANPLNKGKICAVKQNTQHEMQVFLKYPLCIMLVELAIATNLIKEEFNMNPNFNFKDSSESNVSNYTEEESGIFSGVTDVEGLLNFGRKKHRKNKKKINKQANKTKKLAKKCKHLEQEVNSLKADIRKTKYTEKLQKLAESDSSSERKMLLSELLKMGV